MWGLAHLSCLLAAAGSAATLPLPLGLDKLFHGVYENGDPVFKLPSILPSVSPRLMPLSTGAPYTSSVTIPVFPTLTPTMVDPPFPTLGGSGTGLGSCHGTGYRTGTANGMGCGTGFPTSYSTNAPASTMTWTLSNPTLTITATPEPTSSSLTLTSAIFQNTTTPLVASTTTFPSTSPSTNAETSISASVTTPAEPTSNPSPEVPAPEPTRLQFRGVNVGNWLILERFMDSGEMFKDQFASAVDQWTFDSIPGAEDALKTHWDTWFNETHVQRLQSYGFNALRIPIGFWAFDNTGTPYKQGAAEYVDKAIVWARNAGMKVMVDCHGSPGSQNGQDHSGRTGAVHWQEEDNLERSKQILRTIVSRYGGMENSDVVFGIEIVSKFAPSHVSSSRRSITHSLTFLDEPTPDSPNSFTTSQDWASEVYSSLQDLIASSNLNKDLEIITHDSFMGPTQFIPIAQKLTSPIKTPTFSVDQHNYQLYTPEDMAMAQPEHIAKACGWSSALQTTRSAMPVYVGEWTPLTHICVRADGNTFGGTECAEEGCQCVSTNTEEWGTPLVEQVRRYAEAQLDIFEANADGWFVWSAGGPGGWGVENLIGVGAFPNPISSRMNTAQC